MTVKIYKKRRYKLSYRHLEDPEAVFDVKTDGSEIARVRLGKHYWETDETRPCNAPTAKPLLKPKPRC